MMYTTQKLRTLTPSDWIVSDTCVCTHYGGHRNIVPL